MRKIISLLLVFLFITSVSIPTVTAEPAPIAPIGVAVAPAMGEVIIGGIELLTMGVVGISAVPLPRASRAQMLMQAWKKPQNPSTMHGRGGLLVFLAGLMSRVKTVKDFLHPVLLCMITHLPALMGRRKVNGSLKSSVMATPLRLRK